MKWRMSFVVLAYVVRYSCHGVADETLIWRLADYVLDGVFHGGGCDVMLVGREFSVMDQLTMH